jgi:hypothetical protein
MTRGEYCPGELKSSQAIRQILFDLRGKLIHFPKDSWVYYILRDLKMEEFRRGEITYWRCCPYFERVYINFNDEANWNELQSTGKLSWARDEYISWLKAVMPLRSEIIQVE